MCAFKPMFSHPAWKSPWPKMQIENKNSIAYRMALVSNGKFDSMMALNTKSDWDVAAGDLIINEAGGKVTDHKGNQLLYNLENTSHKKRYSISNTNLRDFNTISLYKHTHNNMPFRRWPDICIC